MSKATRKARAQAPAMSGLEGVFALWGRGNLKAARASARGLLQQGELSEQDRAQLERLLADTAPDPRAAQIAVFSAVVVLLVILLTKLFD